MNFNGPKYNWITSMIEHITTELKETFIETGKKLTQKAMGLLEQRFEREAGVERWFVTIRPLPFDNV